MRIAREFDTMRITITLLLMMLLGATTRAQAAHRAPSDSDSQRLVGAWRLVSLGEVAPDGKASSVSGLKGTLIYTTDGHMSVQLMYPDSAVTNDYVLNGYEASF